VPRRTDGFQHLIEQPVHSTGNRSARPCNCTRDHHAVALVESTCDHILLPHAEVEFTARRLHDLLHELLEDLATRAVELIGVENLVKHDRACRDLHGAHGSPLPVLMVGDNDAVLVNALPCFDTALECVLPDVREHVPVGLEMSVDRLEIAETRVL
jgi:hypothetical protein